MIPYSAAVGQKISASGVVSTYSIPQNLYAGGILTPNGEIHFMPAGASCGTKLSFTGARPWGIGTCCSPWMNKF